MLVERKATGGKAGMHVRDGLYVSSAWYGITSNSNSYRKKDPRRNVRHVIVVFHKPRPAVALNSQRDESKDGGKCRLELAKAEEDQKAGGFAGGRLR